jgi:hypothetical protein
VDPWYKNHTLIAVHFSPYNAFHKACKSKIEGANCNGAKSHDSKKFSLHRRGKRWGHSSWQNMSPLLNILPTAGKGMAFKDQNHQLRQCHSSIPGQLCAICTCAGISLFLQISHPNHHFIISTLLHNHLPPHPEVSDSPDQAAH